VFKGGQRANLTPNHRSPRAKRFANYALKTGMDGVTIYQYIQCLYTEFSIILLCLLGQTIYQGVLGNAVIEQ
jgi:hypothetical protein